MFRLSTNLILAALASLVPAYCWAGTSVPFDVGGLILWVAFYVVGLIVLFVGAVRARSFLVALVMVIYVIAPAAWIASGDSEMRQQNAKVLAESEAGDKANEQAFSEYCKDRQRKVFTTVHLPTGHQDRDRAVYVKFDGQFTASSVDFNAGVIARQLQMNPNDCARTGLVALEGAYDGAYVEGKGYTPEIWRYDACTRGPARTVSASEARYELVLGETGRKDQVPWGGDRGRWMSRTSVRLVDRQDASILAEDTLYFLRYESGVGDCAKAEEQLADLFSAVFRD